MKHYKVVRITESGQKVSAWANGSLLEKQYKENAWTHADERFWQKGLGLFIFHDLEFARKYAKFYWDAELWEVETGEVKPFPKLLMSNFERLDQIDSFLSLSDSEIDKIIANDNLFCYMRVNNQRDYSVVTDRIKLIRKLDF